MQSKTSDNILVAEVKGWAISPVHKSVNANPDSKIWKVVTWKVFFQIAAKTSAFPVTVTSDKIATMIEHENVAPLM